MQNLTIHTLNLADVNSVLAFMQGLGISDWGGNLGTSRVTGLSVFTVVMSPVLIAANTTAEQTFTVQGLVLGSGVYVNKPTAQAGLGIVGARVSATDQIGITFSNNTGAGITPTASETYIVVAIRSA